MASAGCQMSVLVNFYRPKWHLHPACRGTYLGSQFRPVAALSARRPPAGAKPAAISTQHSQCLVILKNLRCSTCSRYSSSPKRETSRAAYRILRSIAYNDPSLLPIVDQTSGKTNRFYELGIAFTRSESSVVLRIQKYARLAGLPNINDDGS